MKQNKFYSFIKSSAIRFLVGACLLTQAGIPYPVRADQPGAQNSNVVSSAIGGCPMFPANNIWNAPVDNLPVHARSDQWVNTIGRYRGFHMDFGTVWDGGPIGIPYNVVGSGVPKVYVNFEYDDESDIGPYPIPSNPLIEYGSDRHILIVDSSTCTLYELFAASYSGGQWYAGSGAIWNLNSNALRPDEWTSADAAGLPILPGLVRYEEVMSGEIDHAIRFTASNTNGYIWPARHLTSDDPDAPQIPPMGARFRLKASYDISGYPATLQVILRAMKTYGIILADNGSNWYVSGAPDSQWDDDMLHLLDDLTGDDFEAVDASGLMVDYDSGATGSMPGAATLVSPTGSIGTNTPVYTWNVVPGATWYYLWINGVSGNIFKQWYTAAQASCNDTTCSVTPAGLTLSSGSSYTWWVQTWNTVGYGPWSAGMTFSVPPPPLPGQATLVSPTGSIGTNNPTYSWNKVSASTWYYLSVSGPSGYAFTKWYDASVICGESTCSAANATPSLAAGAYTWKVQTWNSVGYGPWSADMGFNVPVPTPPGGATLVSPTGSIGDNNPTYTWNKVSASTWYYMSVSGPSGYAFTRWYDASVVCGESTCSAANATPSLAAGAYTWKVQTWNSAGFGPWSADMSFSTPVPPGAATLVSLTGTMTDPTPIYTWNEVPTSTWYYLWVNGPSGVVVKQWYSSSEAHCDGSTCWVEPTTTLTSGLHTWWIQTWNSAGYGPWSTAMNFTVSP